MNINDIVELKNTKDRLQSLNKNLIYFIEDKNIMKSIDIDFRYRNLRDFVSPAFIEQLGVSIKTKLLHSMNNVIEDELKKVLSTINSIESKLK